MRKLTLIVLFLLVATVGDLFAAMADYKDDFEINLEKDKIPSLQELEKFFYKESTLYSPRYKSVYDLLGNFDSEFYQISKNYGRSEKRLKWPQEDQIIAILEKLPKEMYPYIGPMLFEVPGMSEKVLNMPGIKETKNQFPKVIAEQLKDVEDIEFLSPFLYYILMPEVWPENYRRVELPQLKDMHPKVNYDENFYLALKKIVLPENYMPGNKNSGMRKSDLRTINPTPDTLLTAADVAAFARTIDATQNWFNDNIYELSRVTSMWLNYDNEKGDETVPGMKDMVNPCQRLVQKAQILGKERELAALVAGEGWTLYEWAYTCDKTIKAFRLGHISSTMVQALRMYRSGVYDEETEKLSPQMRAWRFSTMQAISEMYNAPLSDVKEVRKNRISVNEKLKNYGYRLFGVTLGLFE